MGTSRSTTRGNGEACPSDGDLALLLQPNGREPLSAVAVLRHLLGSCPSCWQCLATFAEALEPSHLPFRDPLAMTIHSAALGIAKNQDGRFSLMRPLHRHDAFQAHASSLAFCRLLLHETLAAALRPPKDVDTSIDDPMQVFDDTKTWLRDACMAFLKPAARLDLEALTHTYRAFVYLLNADSERAQFHIHAADALLGQGEQRAEPRVTWWTFSASKERWQAAAGGADRQHHLWRAEYCLRRALRRLPVTGYGEQRAELLHDQAQVCLQLDAVQRAGKMLARADQLLTRLGPAAGTCLRTMVLIGRAQVEARLAPSYPTTEGRHQSIRQVWSFFQHASELGCFDADELDTERRSLECLLEALDDKTSAGPSSEPPRDDDKVPS